MDTERYQGNTRRQLWFQPGILSANTKILGNQTTLEVCQNNYDTSVVRRKGWKLLHGEIGAHKVRVKSWIEPAIPHTNEEPEERRRNFEEEVRNILLEILGNWRALRNNCKRIAPLVGVAMQIYPSGFRILCPITLHCKYGDINEFSRVKGISLPGRLRLLSQVADALEYMHRLNPPVSHQHVKGSNILISDKREAQLTDIGFHTFTQWAYCRGDLTNRPPEPYEEDLDNVSLQWRAPETVVEKSTYYTPQADVWSFGMTIFEVLTGDIPYPEYKRRTEGNLIRDVFLGKKLPTPPQDGDPTIGRLRALMQGCWERDPSRRLSICEVGEQLRKICDRA